MIPLTIVSGFLGVGKTTLIDHFIYSNNDNKPSRLAVIVNDLSRFNADVEIMKSNYLRDSSNSASNENSAIENNNDNDGADNKSTSNQIISSSLNSNQSTKKPPAAIVKLKNGCICCASSSNGELFQSIRSLLNWKSDDLSDSTKDNDFDCILLECSGVSDPKQIVGQFEEARFYGDEEDVCSKVFVSGVITVVDASRLIPIYKMKSLVIDNVNETGFDETKDPVTVGKTSIVELLVSQIEAANVVIINKIDLLKNQENSNNNNLLDVVNLLQLINADAKQIESEFGRVDLSKIQSLLKGNLESSSSSSSNTIERMHKKEIKAHQTENDGNRAEIPAPYSHGKIVSFVYSRRKPFHPNRLFKCISQEWFKEEDLSILGVSEETKDKSNENKSIMFGVLRSKGICWLSDENEMAMFWNQAGGMKPRIAGMGAWWAVVPRDQWPDPQSLVLNDEIDDIEKDFQEPYGDRRQEIVFIGIKGVMNKDKICESLDTCLFQDGEEMDLFHELMIGAKKKKKRSTTNSNVSDVCHGLDNANDSFDLDNAQMHKKQKTDGKKQ